MSTKPAAARAAGKTPLEASSGGVWYLDRLASRFGCPLKEGAYFNEVLIVVKVLLRVVPKPFTAAMIASAMPAAIRPYSIAVAPV